jgi:hypothetical protein
VGGPRSAAAGGVLHPVTGDRGAAVAGRRGPVQVNLTDTGGGGEPGHGGGCGDWGGGAAHPTARTSAVVRPHPHVILGAVRQAGDGAGEGEVGGVGGPRSTVAGGVLDGVTGDGGAAVICGGGPGEVELLIGFRDCQGGGCLAGGDGGERLPVVVVDQTCLLRARVAIQYVSSA